jgi:hypothetical protein
MENLIQDSIGCLIILILTEKDKEYIENMGIFSEGQKSKLPSESGFSFSNMTSIGREGLCE